MDAREFQKGIDIAKMGVHVVAPADGLRVEISDDPDVGMVIKINHGYGMATSLARFADCRDAGNYRQERDIIATWGIPDEREVRISITP